MNIERLIQSVGYVLAKYNYVLNYTKLIKLLYLSDRKSLSLTGYSITGDHYVSMKNGPVLSTLYDLIKNKSRDRQLQFYWNSKFATDGYEIHQVCTFIPCGELSSGDMQIIDEIDTRFHANTYSDMIDFVHDPSNCPEWKDTQSSIPLSKSEILRTVGFSESDIDAILEEEDSYAEEEKLLDSLDYPISQETVYA